MRPDARPARGPLRDDRRARPPARQTRSYRCSPSARTRSSTADLSDAHAARGDEVGGSGPGLRNGRGQTDRSSGCDRSLGRAAIARAAACGPQPTSTRTRRVRAHRERVHHGRQPGAQWCRHTSTVPVALLTADVTTMKPLDDRRLRSQSGARSGRSAAGGITAVDGGEPTLTALCRIFCDETDRGRLTNAQAREMADRLLPTGDRGDVPRRSPAASRCPHASDAVLRRGRGVCGFCVGPGPQPDRCSAGAVRVAAT